eukprot:TRINITY_DN6268_c0_g1_i1.p1 TRINITY_DN6268_c0_g1~~TRINITY_DN6268_c0_g1_i1.p1  ORF type:complete len:729 (-),score=96.11 TRINITY_DN6268_c0_g1_i1:263-2449(-)
METSTLSENKARTLSCGIFTILLAVFLFGFGFLGQHIILQVFQLDIEKDICFRPQDQIDKDIAYERFVDNTYEGMAPQLAKFVLWNITNIDQLLNGEKPRLSEVGPYYYRIIKKKLNVTFLDHGKISYYLWQYYVYDSNRTNEKLNPDIDKIFNMNPVYLNLMSGQGGEMQLRYEYISPLLSSWINFFESDYVGDALLFYMRSLLKKNIDGIITAITKKGVSENEAKHLTYSAWANDSSTGSIYGIHFPDSLKISLGKNSSNISFTSTQLLFENMDEFSFAYNKSKFNHGVIKKWINSSNSEKQHILDIFQITDVQYKYIIEWLNSVEFKEWTRKEMSTLFSISKFEDLALVQFGQGSVSESVRDIYTTKFDQNFVQPELFFSGGGSIYKLDTIKKLFYGTRGILKDPENMKVFYNEAVSKKHFDYKYLNKVWGIVDEKMRASLVNSTFKYRDSYCNNKINMLIKQGSGLFQERSATDWIFSYCDPLYETIKPNSPCFSFRQNITSSAEALKTLEPTVIHSGVNNLLSISEALSINGNNVSSYGEPISGNSADGQFYPFWADFESIDIPSFTVWSYDYDIPVFLTPEKYDATKKPKFDIFKGIKMYRYEVSNSTWETAEGAPYHNNFTGFRWMGPLYNNIPLYIGKPYYYGSNPEWLDKVEGISQPSPNGSFVENTYSQLGIEPETGKVMHSSVVFQINIHLNSSIIKKWFDYPGGYQNVFIFLFILV